MENLRKHDGETKEKLLRSARMEFMEKGFAGASLRRICSQAGVTTGALYFFFRDKDDLFCQVVGNLLDRLNAIIEAHLAYEQEQMGNAQTVQDMQHDDRDDYNSVVKIVHELYTYREETLLILTKAQGSSMEAVPDRLVNEMDTHNFFLCESMCRANGVPMVEQKVIHWMSHSQIDMFIFMVTHIEEEKEALQFAMKGMKYLLGGWYGLVKA